MSPKYKVKDWITDGRSKSGYVTAILITVTFDDVDIKYRTVDNYKIDESGVKVCTPYTWMDELAFKIKGCVGGQWTNTRQLCKALGYSYGYQNVFKQRLYELKKQGLIRMRTRGSAKKVSVREWKLVNPELRR